MLSNDSLWFNDDNWDSSSGKRSKSMFGLKSAVDRFSEGDRNQKNTMAKNRPTTETQTDEGLPEPSNNQSTRFGDIRANIDRAGNVTFTNSGGKYTAEEGLAYKKALDNQVGEQSGVAESAEMLTRSLENSREAQKRKGFGLRM